MTHFNCLSEVIQKSFFQHKILIIFLNNVKYPVYSTDIILGMQSVINVQKSQSGVMKQNIIK